MGYVGLILKGAPVPVNAWNVTWDMHERCVLQRWDATPAAIGPPGVTVPLDPRTNPDGG
jgi:hypothetical protein